jgi:hypothetical protein
MMQTQAPKNLLAIKTRLKTTKNPLVALTATSPPSLKKIAILN